MANWLNIAGGVGQGVTLGLQDMREMEKQKFLREQQEFLKQQQEQQRREWADQEEVRQRVSQVRRSTPGYYGQPTNFPIRDDEYGNLMPGASETARPAREVYADLANVYAGSSNPRLAQMGLQYQTAAAQAGELEFTTEQRNRIKEAQKRYQEMLANIGKDPYGAAEQLMTQFNNNMFGGPGTEDYITTGMSTPNGPVVGVYSRSQPTRPVMQIPVNPQSLQQVARSAFYNELAAINPEFAKLQLQNEELGIKGATAASQIGVQNEQVRTGNWGALGQNNAYAALLSEQLRTGNWGQLGINRANAAAGRIINNPPNFGVNEKGEPVYGYVSVGADGKPKFVNVDLPPGVRPLKPPRAVSPELEKQIVAELGSMPTDRAAAQNHMVGMFAKYGEENVRAVMGQRGGNDPTVAAALANPPGKDKPAAKPADKPADKPTPATQQEPTNEPYLRNKKLREESEAKRAENVQKTARMAASALETKDPAAALGVMDSIYFGELPLETRTKINNLVRGK